ncbi:peroxidase 5-like [Vitis riparia]|uniref:peroxidase 5-like n=1 Tax=Vitis riparia TaxID=96939 RepID=UPI00155B05C7|nr:peroxidase 5-like [Vitis riparia]
MEAAATIITVVVILCWLQFSSVECHWRLRNPRQPNQTEASTRPQGTLLQCNDKLQDRFYRNTCPQAENIIAKSVYDAVLVQPGLAAGLIRLHFHDCFVNGCDASILLDTTPSGEPVEKTSRANVFASQIFKYIDRLKADIERECPGVVSCADILAYATREAVKEEGLPYYLVPGGRRDGLSSSASNVAGNIPSPNESLKNMTQIFLRKGLSIEDMVVLFGAHSIGHTHCRSLFNRLYNYSSTQAQDPSMDFAHSLYLKGLCPKAGPLFQEVIDKVMVPLEPITPSRLDTLYYTQLLKGEGVLQTDQALTNNPTTNEIVKRFSQNPLEWGARFTSAMINLGKVDVLTGQEGEIRRNCRAVN